MASHRRPRPRTAVVTAPRAVIGLTSAALATVTLLSESAAAAPSKPEPSVQEVQAKVDALNHQADTATQRYNQAQATTGHQRTKANALLNQVAAGAEQLNATRRTLGEYAAAQYRTNGLGPTATLLLSNDPQAFFDSENLLKRGAAQQSKVLTRYEDQMAATARQRTQASQSLLTLQTAQQKLDTDRRAVQDKLRQAQTLLNSLNRQQKERLAQLQAQREAAARASAARLAAASHATSSASYATKAARAIAFAKAQLGKPYVWGATGPNSYDCSGLVQAAWAAAGVTLPRTTWDQVDVGTRVAISDLEPGDLVFYYSDISHVAMYIGDGEMIQAPHTGAVIDIQPVTEMPIYGATRPA
ncbi:NlpC/P60 family protein [Streptomyces sp. SL13]|uniref:NlpC/P60 family protein n=1 Tax=Streptantibioticus silvisoli TaxID=2705255 RepID=A0AA90GZW4_9ACTN|nr:NlpC/P60 family protein [Streptantibioticus silvisoli]MDI5971373.1 NlpC/P60 family protein [Streptantibioticus silvisoli]